MRGHGRKGPRTVELAPHSRAGNASPRNHLGPGRIWYMLARGGSLKQFQNVRFKANSVCRRFLGSIKPAHDGHCDGRRLSSPCGLLGRELFHLPFQPSAAGTAAGNPSRTGARDCWASPGFPRAASRSEARIPASSRSRPTLRITLARFLCPSRLADSP
jgi:hypothetical protein